jgi:hypothetical protein
MDEMATKHKNIYLWLALICFLGIIFIFIFDGYMGVYDSLVTDNVQYRQTINAEMWDQQEQSGYINTMNVDRAGRIDFTYTIENHWFSEYNSMVSASVWSSQKKLGDLKTETIDIKPFNKSTIAWTLDASRFVPADLPSDQTYSMNVIIQRGDIERKLQIYVNPLTVGIKEIPVPVP